VCLCREAATQPGKTHTSRTESKIDFRVICMVNAPHPLSNNTNNKRTPTQHSIPQQTTAHHNTAQHTTTQHLTPRDFTSLQNSVLLHIHSHTLCATVLFELSPSPSHLNTSFTWAEHSPSNSTPSLSQSKSPQLTPH
jgi:hypothetical protein